MLDKRLRSILLHVFKSLKGMNAKCSNYMFASKLIHYSMRQAVKLVKPQRKTTTVGLKTVPYWGDKLWNDNALLCNELWNEDFLTVKRTVHDSKLDIIRYDDFQYLWKSISALLILIFSCDQASLCRVQSFRPSVRLFVTPFSLCSCHRFIMEFSGIITIDRSDIHAKVQGQGQRSKVKVTKVETQFRRFRTVTPVMAMK